MITAMGLSLAQRVAALPPAVRASWLEEQPDWLVEEMARGEWWWVARPEQIPPLTQWMVSLFLAGRGAGKSRSGAEWIVQRALDHPYDRSGAPTEWAVIAETLSDGRLVCVEGPAGILRVLQRRRIVYRYMKSPKPMILFESGSRIHVEGADDADVGRGMNLSGAWLDEVCKWKDSYGSWYEGIMPSLRADLIGDHPRAFVTTTPKPIKLLQEWVKRRDGSVHMIRGSTYDNKANLSLATLRELETRYAGTTIGRQELHGEILDGLEGAVFSRRDIENHRVPVLPPGVQDRVIGVDPSATGEDDEMGIVVVGRRRSDNHLFIIADHSKQVVGREAALLVWKVFIEYGASKVVYEQNMGRKWLTQVLRDAYFELVKEGLLPEVANPPMRGIDAKYGKRTRAEPVGMRLEQGRLHFVGRMEQLEDQCVEFVPEDSRDSPDRMDAMVHGARHFMEMERKRMSMTTAKDAEDLLRRKQLDEAYQTPGGNVPARTLVASQLDATYAGI